MAFLRARLALRRREEGRALFAGLGARLLFFVPAWAPAAFLMRYGETPLDGIWWWMLLPFGVPFALTLALGPLLLLQLPAELWETGRELQRMLTTWSTRLVQGSVEEQLRQRGRVDRAWYEASPLRRWAVRALLVQDAGLVEDADGLRLLTAAPTDCPSCGAGLHAIGPGLRRCHHCDHQRHDALPPVSPLFVRQRMPSRRTLREQLVADNPELTEQLRYGGFTWLVHLVGLGICLAMGWADLPEEVAIPFLIVTMLAPFATVWYLGHAAWGAILSVRDRWRLGARFQHHLRDEVLRQVGEAGAVPLADLSARLGVPTEALTEAVARLGATGELPIAFDHTGELLVDRRCPNTDTRCEGCGGRLRPERRGLVCTSCDRVEVALREAATTGEMPARSAASGPTFRLTLDQPLAAPGQTVSGHVAVGFGGPRRCEGVRVRLLRRLDGDGDEDDDDVFGEVLLLQHAEVLDTNTTPFSFTVPCDSVSYAGKVLAVRWWVQAHLLEDDRTTSAPLRVAPAVVPPPDLASHRELLVHLRAVETRLDWFWLYLVGGGLILLPCTAIYLGAVYTFVRSLLDGQLAQALGAGLFCLLVGLGAVETARPTLEELLAWLRVRGRLTAPSSALLGEVIRPTLTSAGTSDAVRWELSHVERSGRTVHKQVSGSSQPTVRWSAARVVHASGDWPAEGSPAVTVPPTGPATAIAHLREIDWELRVFVTRARWTRTIVQIIDVLPCLAPGATTPADG